MGTSKNSFLGQPKSAKIDFSRIGSISVEIFRSCFNLHFLKKSSLISLFLSIFIFLVCLLSDIKSPQIIPVFHAKIVFAVFVPNIPKVPIVPKVP
jgi:hypothetical protein